MYYIIEGYGPEELERNVQKFLKDNPNYECTGGICSNGGFYQAVHQKR